MEIEKSKMKPCPFCGSDSLRINRKDVGFIGQNEFGTKKIKCKVYVMCNRCFSKGRPVVFDHIKDTEEGRKALKEAELKAVEYWNKRGYEYGN